MNPVVHFELPYHDANRIKEFYSKVFDWTMNPLGPQMNHYILVSTTDQDVKREAFKGSINGGLIASSLNGVSAPSLVLAVEDIHESIALIKENGGEVLNEPMDIPGTGLISYFLDTEGNKNSILQPISM